MRGAIIFIILFALAQDASAYWWIDFEIITSEVDCE